MGIKHQELQGRLAGVTGLGCIGPDRGRKSMLDSFADGIGGLAERTVTAVSTPRQSVADVLRPGGMD